MWELYIVHVHVSFTIYFLPHSMVPAKVVHDWKTLLISGQPLYPDTGEGDKEGEGESSSRLSQSTSTEPPTDVVRDTLLDETDFWQYRVCINPFHSHFCYVSLCVCLRMYRWIGWQMN